VTDGNGATNNVTATRFGALAGTGVGSNPDPIETTVSNLEAQTTTGGLFLTNSGNVSIGGVSASLSGLGVTTSGNISLVASRTITLTDTDGLQTVTGGSTSGDVSLTANGASSDITSSVDNDAVTASAGSISLGA